MPGKSAGVAGGGDDHDVGLPGFHDRLVERVVRGERVVRVESADLPTGFAPGEEAAHQREGAAHADGGWGQYQGRQPKVDGVAEPWQGRSTGGNVRMEVVDGQESRWKEQGKDGDTELKVGVDAQQVGFVIGVFAEQVAAHGQAGHEGRRDWWLADAR